MVSACEQPDIKTQLEELKKQAAELNQQMAKLEAEIAATDSSDGNIKSTQVTVSSLMPQTFTNYITVQGKVDAEENVSISAEMAGMLSKIYVQPGQEVVKGQILAELDNSTFVKGIAELQTALEFATEMYNKQKGLWDQKIGTEVQYLSAKNQKESLEKKMASLQSQFDLAKIQSPINGTVDAVDVKIGQMIMPGLPAIRVVNFSNLKVKAEVAESYAASVKKGSPVNLIFPDLQDTVKTEISYAAKVINPMSRSFMVEINLTTDKIDHPNMLAVLQISNYTNDSAIIVPVNTVQESNDRKMIALAQGNKVSKKEIKTGKSYNGYIEVLSGLKRGDVLITGGYQDLNEGETIKY
jgi:RND family efflux transporter MFP subunit